LFFKLIWNVSVKLKGTELITFVAALTQNLDKVQTLGIPVSVALVNVPGQK